MIQLTKDQHDALVQDSICATKVLDPITNAEYVLLSAAAYARLNGMIDADFHISDAYPAMESAFAELWNDPRMDDYDRYEELKK